jgi:hypothetical protein
VEDFSTPKVMFQIGMPPSRIDFLPSVPGVEFAPCWTNREVVSLGYLSIPFISKSDLILAKLYANRPQDQIDVQALRDTEGPGGP